MTTTENGRYITRSHKHTISLTHKESLIVLIGFDRLLHGIMKKEIKLEENKKLVLNKKLEALRIHEYIKKERKKKTLKKAMVKFYGYVQLIELRAA